jgi:hypothetical protein
MTHLGSTEQQPRPRWPYLVAAAAVAALIATAGTVWWWQQQRETCEDWSTELIAAIEDGTLVDGTFEASEACREQMRRDLGERRD